MLSFSYQLDVDTFSYKSTLCMLGAKGFSKREIAFMSKPKVGFFVLLQLQELKYMVR